MVHQSSLASDNSQGPASTRKERCKRSRGSVAGSAAAGGQWGWVERFLADAPRLDEVEVVRLAHVLQMMGR